MCATLPFLTLTQVWECKVQMVYCLSNFIAKLKPEIGLNVMVFIQAIYSTNPNLKLG